MFRRLNHIGILVFRHLVGQTVNAEILVELHLVHVFLNILVHRQIVDLNVSSTQNVLVYTHVCAKNVEIHVQDHAARWRFVMSLIIPLHVPVAKVTLAIHLLNVILNSKNLWKFLTLADHHHAVIMLSAMMEYVHAFPNITETLILDVDLNAFLITIVRRTKFAEIKNALILVPICVVNLLNVLL